MNIGKAAELSEREVQAISRAISDPRRFDILKHIAAQSCTPCSCLREEFPITAATMSHHLKELEEAGLIEMTRRGKYVDLVFLRDAWDRYISQLKDI